ncbi:MAG: response regulator [Chloroflexi bacterium]|nr:response regulator [Chloroflexota bacterium]
MDDIAETRENIKKLLAFEEQEFRVVGSVGTGREAIKAAIETRPDIVIMDINMPDMDGITATGEISKRVPTAAVIMMSVQTDADYMKKAMQAGARQFLGKPIDTDELYSTIRAVYNSYKPFRDQAAAMQDMPVDVRKPQAPIGEPGTRAGHVIVVYSAQGGSGCTTIATNLASGLMKKNVRVLLVDANLQFGDVGVFLKLQSQSTLIDLVGKIEDLDTDFFDSVVATHDSGLKVLLGPLRPEFAEEVEAVPQAVSRMVEKIADGYDYVVIDTSRRVDEHLLSLTDIASKVLLVFNPTLAGIKNTKFVIELFDRLNYPPEKSLLVLNRVEDERSRQRVTIATEQIERFLKKQVFAKIPDAEREVLGAVMKGVPIVASRDRSKSPVKEFVDLADHMATLLMGAAAEHDSSESEERKPQQKKAGLGLLGRN